MVDKIVSICPTHGNVVTGFLSVISRTNGIGCSCTLTCRHLSAVDDEGDAKAVGVFDLCVTAADARCIVSASGIDDAAIDSYGTALVVSH